MVGGMTGGHACRGEAATREGGHGGGGGGGGGGGTRCRCRAWWLWVNLPAAPVPLYNTVCA